MKKRSRNEEERGHSGEGKLPAYTRALAEALGNRDPYTVLHSERVAGLAESVGRRMKLSEEELENLVVAATFHDIGKIGVPDRILLKPLQLDEPEIEVMRHHARAGADLILETQLEGSDEIARAVLHHHENYDGKGYPDGLVGNEIPVASRIIGIVDSYDAMAGRNPYRKPRSHERIMKILEEETGEKHDPELMNVFREVIETSPHKAQA